MENKPLGHFQYELEAFKDTLGSELRVGPATVATTQAPPSPPSDLTAVVVDSNSVRLSWINNSEIADSFVVDQSLGNIIDFLRIGTVTVDSAFFLITALIPEVRYYLRVRAKNDFGISRYSPALSVRIGN